MTISELKSEARENGIKWSDVEATYKALRAEENAVREYDREIRTTVWDQYAETEDRKRWWRYGMEQRFGKAFAEGDRDLIPGFDACADGLKTLFAEFDCDDPAEKLFEFLKTEWVRMTPRVELMGRALEMVREGQVEETNDEIEFAFGFNVEAF